jgi:LytS/YehU family sensor histidine kinase
MFSHRYRYLFAFLLSVYTYINTEFCGVYEHFGIEIEWEFALMTIILETVMILEVNRLIESKIRKWVSFEKNKFGFPLIFFFVGGMLGSIVTISVVLFIGMVIHHYPIKENITPLKLNLTYAWLVNLLLHLLNTVIYYFEEYKTKRNEAEALKKYHEEAELQMLRTQINPHFLFNNLNVLSSLVMQNNAQANDFIEAFSKVYRYILSNHQKEIVPVEEEIQFMKPYIFLLQKRFGEGLNIVNQLNTPMPNSYVIPAALQMLVENAIKHNVSSKSKPLSINIWVEKNHLCVSNNLQPKQTKEPSTEIGLKNIKKRYELISNQQVAIVNNAKEFKVSLPLITVSNQKIS